MIHRDDGCSREGDWAAGWQTLGESRATRVGGRRKEPCELFCSFRDLATWWKFDQYRRV